MPGGRAVSSRLSRSLTPLASRRSWTRSRTLQTTSPRSRKTWTFCTTRWTWRTPATVALTWRTTTASSAPPSRSSGGCGQHPGRGHGRRPSEPAVGRGEPRGGPLGGRRGRKAVWGVGSGEGWTGGTDSEGARGLRAFRGGAWRRESPVWSQLGSAPQEAVSREEGRVGCGPWRDQWVPRGCPSCWEPGGTGGGGGLRPGLGLGERAGLSPGAHVRGRRICGLADL